MRSEVNVEWFSMFEDAIGQAQEVMHGGANDAHFGFACCQQPLGSRFEEWIAAAGDHGWQVERFSEATVARFAKACFTSDGAAGFFLGGGEPRISGHLAGAGEVSWVREFGKDHRCGAIADSGNGAKQFGLFS